MNWKNKKGYRVKFHFKGMQTPMDRRAVFVFRTPGGIAWVEPAYLDPYNAGNAGHEFDGTITETENGATVQTERGEIRIEEAQDSEIKNLFNLMAKQAKTTYNAEYKNLKKMYDNPE